MVKRNLKQGVKSGLRKRAARRGLGMEEPRDAPQNVAPCEDTRGAGIGSEMAAAFRGVGSDLEIQELRGFKLEAAVFRCYQ